MGITATKYRKCVTPFAIFITLAQLMQMLVGMYVTIKAVLHQTHGQECYVNKTNSVLGLGMYFSYFVLFFKLFVDNYCLNRKGSSISRENHPFRWKWYARLPRKRLTRCQLSRRPFHFAFLFVLFLMYFDCVYVYFR